ncbi:MAG: dihydrodipicolinate synthase family protein [Clostridia bacterium]|nr:dihydrodipicolinate synthase family protein [Clostridia bacterium]
MDLFSTMITPYTAEGHVDYETAKQYVDWYFEQGLTGIFAICQSSEIFFLSQEERVELNRVVYARAKELERKHDRPFTVVSSGHVSDSLEEQAAELNAVWESGTDALILITNRLDPNNEGDEVWIRNAETLLKRLPKEARLGLYECPYPYKRLLSPKILDWCLSVGRFDYLKDTCCDADLIASRCRQLEGSSFRLLNANGQTLLDSMRRGGKGYCGVMCNYHPALYAWLAANWQTRPEEAELVQALLGTWSFLEGGLPYPLTAKYHMTLCGIPTENRARNRKSEEMTDYARDCVRQLKLASDSLEIRLGIRPGKEIFR